MKNIILLLLISVFSFSVKSQDNNDLSVDTLTKELAENACLCIDSISVRNKGSKEISEGINSCIKEGVGALMLGTQLMNINLDDVSSDTTIQVNFNIDPDSDEYKKYYYKLERYLMDNCESIKIKIGVNEEKSENSVSDNPEALEWYHKGIDEGKLKNYKAAIKNYKKALKIDPEFAFAWDNLGLCYRKLEKYKKAIKAYKKSLKINPEGKTPLMNIAVVYLYDKNYDKAIEAYNNLAKIDSENPEVFYGIGITQFKFKHDNEKALDNMCKAYLLYIEQNSPYRTDVEKIINNIYSVMKENGNEKRFNEILKENKISTSSEED